MRRVDLGVVDYEQAAEDMYRDFTAGALPGVTMCSPAELAAEQGVPAPTETRVRDAVATALGAA
jgi:hypothetical protein